MKDVPDVEEVDEEEPVSTEAKKTDTRGEHGSLKYLTLRDMCKRLSSG